VLAKHSKSFSLIDCISVGVDRMQRNFDPMRKQVEAWQKSEVTDVTAKVVVYEAFVEGKLEVPKHLARTVHDLYIVLCSRSRGSFVDPTGIVPHAQRRRLYVEVRRFFHQCKSHNWTFEMISSGLLMADR